MLYRTLVSRSDPSRFMAIVDLPGSSKLELRQTVIPVLLQETVTLEDIADLYRHNEEFKRKILRECIIANVELKAWA